MIRSNKTKNKQIMPLKSRILILLFVMVLPFAAFAAYKAADLGKRLESEQAANNLSLAKNTARDIETSISTAEQVLISMANQKDLRTGNFPAVSRWMQWFVPRYSNYHLMALVDTSGKVKALGVSDKMLANEKAWKLSVNDAARYAKSLSSNNISIGNAVHHTTTGMTAIHVVYPVFSYEGKRIGNIVAALDLSGIQSELKQVGLSNHVLVTVIDNKGTILARSAESDKYLGQVVPGSQRAGYAAASKAPLSVQVGTDSGYLQGRMKDELSDLVLVFAPLFLIAAAGLWWVSRGAGRAQETSAQPSVVIPSDLLTGLWDSNKLMSDFVKEHNRAKRYREQLSFAMIDVDHFKRFNEVNGEQQADHALRTIARIVKDTIRETDAVYRYNSDELCVLLPNTDRYGAEYVVKRILSEVESQNYGTDQERNLVNLTASIGVATYPSDSISTEGLIKCADIALSKAKHSGRNKAEFYVDVIKAAGDNEGESNLRSNFS